MGEELLLVCEIFALKCKNSLTIFVRKKITDDKTVET